MAENIYKVIELIGTSTKLLINHIETSQPLLVERLVSDLVRLCFELDTRIQAVELSVEKPTAVRFARSVGVTIYRQRQDILPPNKKG